MTRELVLCLVMAIAAGGVACTLAKAWLFMGLREWAERRGAYIGYFVSCPYCIAHWVVIAEAAVYRPRLIHLWQPLDVVVTTFATIAVACFVAALLSRLYWRA